MEQTTTSQELSPVKPEEHQSATHGEVGVSTTEDVTVTEKTFDDARNLPSTYR